ncbi:MAG: hypothetical protein FWC77_04655 [Defluviitaleaceae bacterium]|nr:hypothetical protein [Defluviitaleaceae bacterium]
MRRLALAILIIIFSLAPVMVHGVVPYSTFFFTDDMEPVNMQAVYLPHAMIGQGVLNNPSAIFIDRYDRIFIADRNNNRIVEISQTGELLQEIGYGILRNPEGLFVDDNGYIYVADTGNGRIVIFDPYGEYLRSFGRGDDIRLQNTMFIPVNVAKDARGVIYILLLGGNEGIMTVTEDGEFLGFFGRNRVQLSIVQRMLRFIYTEEQIRTNLNPVAPSISSMVLGRDGFMYTVTQTAQERQIKQLNANSEDLFGERDRDFQINHWFFGPVGLSAITISESGLIYVADRANGLIFIYDSVGAPVAAFGNRLFAGDFRIGVFGDPVGLGVDSNYNLFVLDRVHNGIHVFTPTNLMHNLVAGTKLYNQGRHDDARENWESILRQNVFIGAANTGLGRIYYREGDFITAMAYMRSAMNQEGYSDARWQQRIIVVREMFPIAAVGLAALFVLWLIYSKILRLEIKINLRPYLPRWFTSWWDETLYALNMLTQPSETIYGVTRGNKGGIISACTWLVIYLVTAVVSMGLTSFSFNRYGLRGFNLVSFLVTNLLPVLVWVLAGYLVGIITKGQGQFSHIFISVVYALLPLAVLRIPLAVLSQALTLHEETIYVFFFALMAAWALILQFIAVKEVQGYFLGEAVKNTCWMLFVSAMLVVFSVALYGITMQSYSFLDEFVRELVGIV